MAERPRAPLLGAAAGAPMGESIPPFSKSQPAGAREDEDPHESVTLAPPAPSFEDMLAEVEPAQPLASRSDDHFRAALDAGARTGLGLSELTKLLGELSGGVIGAKRANEQLVQELASLRALLGSANEQQLSLKHRIAELEQELLTSRAEAERELTFVTEQHDEFVAALIDEHEEELSGRADADTTRMSDQHGDLARQLVSVESARLEAETERERARTAMAKAQAQRDEAQARATRLERERDELRAESSMLRARLGTMRSSSTTPPPPVASTRPPSDGPPDKLRLDASELDSTLHARPRLPSLPGRLTPPPPELERALYAPRPPRSDPPGETASEFPRVDTRPGVGGPKPSEVPPPRSFGPPPRVISVASMPPSEPGTRPLLKQKPDPTTRPLIGYSLGKDNVESETLEGARLSSKPPRK